MSYLTTSSFYGSTPKTRNRFFTSTKENVNDDKNGDFLNDNSQFGKIVKDYYSSPQVRSKLYEETLSSRRRFSSPYSKPNKVLKGTLSCETPRKSRPLKSNFDREKWSPKYCKANKNLDMTFRNTTEEFENKEANDINLSLPLEKSNSSDSLLPSSVPIINSELSPLKSVDTNINTLDTSKKPENLEPEDKENFTRNSSLIDLTDGSVHFQNEYELINTFETKDCDRSPSDPLSLKNLGNTCYMNSIVQSLTVLNKFFTYLNEKYKQLKMNSNVVYNKENFPMTISLLNLFNQYNKQRSLLEQQKNGQQVQINLDEIDDYLNKLKICVGEKSSQFKLNIQQDAVEFLELIISSIEEEFEKMKKYCQSINNQDENPINKYFQLTIEPKLKCLNCKQISTLPKSSVHTIYLSIPESTKNNNFTIQSAIDNYFKDEQTEHRCENKDCNHNIKLRKQYITKYPNILLVQLARYSEDGNKRHEIVNVQNEIHLPCDDNNLSVNRPLTDNINIGQVNNGKTSNKNVYKLISAVCHHGSTLTGGHYVAFVNQMDKKKWFFCDDDVIHKVNLEKAQEGVKTSGYFFFFINKQLL